MIDQNGYLNVIDFGLAKVMPPDGRTYTICGTPMYLAPEVIQKKGHGGEADWWTLGVLVYELLMGYTPFSVENGVQVDNAKQLFRNICDPKFAFAFRDSVDAPARSFIRQMLQHNPGQRIGFQFFNDAIFIKNHAFFEGFDWVGLLQRQLEPPYPGTAPPNTARLGEIASASSTDGFSLDVQNRSKPYQPDVIRSGCMWCPKKRDAETWHDVFNAAGDIV